MVKTFKQFLKESKTIDKVEIKKRYTLGQTQYVEYVAYFSEKDQINFDINDPLYKCSNEGIIKYIKEKIL